PIRLVAFLAERIFKPGRAVTRHIFIRSRRCQLSMIRDLVEIVCRLPRASGGARSLLQPWSGLPGAKGRLHNGSIGPAGKSADWRDANSIAPDFYDPQLVRRRRARNRDRQPN